MGSCSPWALRIEGVTISTGLTGQSTGHKAWPIMQHGSRSLGWGIIHLYGTGHKVSNFFYTNKGYFKRAK